MMKDADEERDDGKTSRKMLKNDRLSWMSDWFSSVISLAGEHLAPSGRASLRCSSQLLLGDRAVALGHD